MAAIKRLMRFAQIFGIKNNIISITPNAKCIKPGFPYSVPGALIPVTIIFPSGIKLHGI